MIYDLIGDKVEKKIASYSREQIAQVLLDNHLVLSKEAGLYSAGGISL